MIRLRLQILLAAALLAASVGVCADSTDLPPCCTKELKPAAKTSDTSLYQLDSKWTTDEGKEIKLVTLGGRPQVVVMFFATCAYACPILVHDLKQIEAALPEEMRGKVGFTLVSFDTERDTVKALATYRKQHKLDSDWTLLRSTEDDILELAALLGVKYKKESSGQFAHSNLITVLNEKGEIIFQQAGLNNDPGAAVKALEKVSSR
jgi:protein SCO1/2